MVCRCCSLPLNFFRPAFRFVEAMGDEGGVGCSRNLKKQLEEDLVIGDISVVG